MLTAIWLGLMLTSVLVGAYTGHLADVAQAVTDYIGISVKIGLTLAGIIVFWTGIMRIGQEAGLIEQISRWLMPILSRLFPEIPTGHPAMGAIVLNMVANMLGLNNAATPFGLKAMEQLEKLNRFPGVASNAMCMFLAINTSSVQLIPATAMGFLIAAGATHPTDIIVTSVLATTCSTIAAIIAVKTLQGWRWFRLPPTPSHEMNQASSNDATHADKPAQEKSS